MGSEEEKVFLGITEKKFFRSFLRKKIKNVRLVEVSK